MNSRVALNYKYTPMNGDCNRFIDFNANTQYNYKMEDKMENEHKVTISFSVSPAIAAWYRAQKAKERRTGSEIFEAIMRPLIDKDAKRG